MEEKISFIVSFIFFFIIKLTATERDERNVCASESDDLVRARATGEETYVKNCVTDFAILFFITFFCLLN